MSQKWVEKYKPTVTLVELWGEQCLERITEVPGRLKDSGLWQQFERKEMLCLAEDIAGLRPTEQLELLKDMNQDIVRRYNVVTAEKL